MGVEQRVSVSPPPSWGAVLASLQAAGHTPRVGMIDGLPAFPDEIPADECQEVRLIFPPGMVTLRRTPDGVACIVWGNASVEVLRIQEACLEAVKSAKST